MVELRDLLSNEQEKVKLKIAELEQLSKQKQELEENLNMEIKEMNKAQVSAHLQNCSLYQQRNYFTIISVYNIS